MTKKSDWLPKEQFQTNGTEVIGWLSSEKGFHDMTARLVFMDGAWHWGEGEEPVKRPDLIKGCMPWPDPPPMSGSSNHDR